MDAIIDSPGLHHPVSRKYDTIDRRYKFFKKELFGGLHLYFPLTMKSKSRRFYPPAMQGLPANSKIMALAVKEVKYKEFQMEQKTSEVPPIYKLKEDMVLYLFTYLHPVDLIHSASLVCHLWKRLANHPTLFKEVRVLVNDHSLAWGSVKAFFNRKSHCIRKLCIDCTVNLPCKEVEALFDVPMLKVTHLDISTFEDMSVNLLRKLASCFPNIETLHMEGMKTCSDEHTGQNCAEKWKEMLKLLFEDEHTFPKIQNFFIGNMCNYLQIADEKLFHWNRPLKMLHVLRQLDGTNYGALRISPFLSTLTSLRLGVGLRPGDFSSIGQLHNLRVLRLSVRINDRDIVQLKNLSKLEELDLRNFCTRDVFPPNSLITLFTLPDRKPELCFPYRLRKLALTNIQVLTEDALQAIARNCPKLRALNLSCNHYMGINAVQHIIDSFKHLVFLDLHDIGSSYNNDVWNNLRDEDLPNLRYLGLRNNPINIAVLYQLNHKRSKMMITFKENYFINWTITESGITMFNNTFDVDINSLMNDLCQIDGYNICREATHFPSHSD